MYRQRHVKPGRQEYYWKLARQHGRQQGRQQYFSLALVATTVSTQCQFHLMHTHAHAHAHIHPIQLFDKMQSSSSQNKVPVLGTTAFVDVHECMLS